MEMITPLSKPIRHQTLQVPRGNTCAARSPRAPQAPGRRAAPSGLLRALGVLPKRLPRSPRPMAGPLGPVESAPPGEGLSARNPGAGPVRAAQQGRAESGGAHPGAGGKGGPAAAGLTRGAEARWPPLAPARRRPSDPAPGWLRPPRPEEWAERGAGSRTAPPAHAG